MSRFALRASFTAGVLISAALTATTLLHADSSTSEDSKAEGPSRVLFEHHTVRVSYDWIVLIRRGREAVAVQFTEATQTGDGGAK